MWKCVINNQLLLEQNISCHVDQVIFAFSLETRQFLVNNYRIELEGLVNEITGGPRDSLAVLDPIPEELWRIIIYSIFSTTQSM